MRHPSRSTDSRLAWVALGLLACATGYLFTAGSSPENQDSPESSLPSLSLAGWAVEVQGPAGSAALHLATPTFALAADQTLHPAIAAAGWQAHLEAIVDLPAPGRYRFFSVVEGGRCQVSLETPSGSLTGDRFQELPATAVRVQARFAAQPGQASRLRLLWEAESSAASFGPELIPASASRVPADREAAISEARATQHGRMLLGDLGCNRCHTAGPAHGGLLRREFPRLQAIASRSASDWLLRWIRDPHQLRADSAMPDLFSRSSADLADSEAIVHYLLSLTTAPRDRLILQDSLIEAGSELYHQVGCVACHGPLNQEPTAAPPVPLGDLQGKWYPGALQQFLQDPASVRPGGRMPSLNLSPAEAEALAAYLGQHFVLPASAQLVVDPAKVEHGAQAYRERGCQACHPLGTAEPIAAKALHDLQPRRGCLHPSAPSAPRFALSSQDRRALQLALKELQQQSLSTDAPLDRGEQLWQALRCGACHPRAGSDGLRAGYEAYFVTLQDTELGDEGRLPPPLDDVGFKLTTSWLHEVLLEGGRARPYMAARMPQFGAAVEELPALLAAASGVWQGAAPAIETSPQQILAGRTLVGTSGLNCISCHLFADREAAGMPGANLIDFYHRLRREWWQGYIQDPMRFKPGTRMPGFFEAGESPIQEVLDGDAVAQAEAMWAYFSLGASMPPPVGLPSSGGLQLQVGERPLVHRTFFADSPRIIAVGLPIGVHYAFDATEVRLLQIWKGDFLDAGAAWSGRGGKVAGGQGPASWQAPEGPALIGKDADLAEFAGYRLDAAGLPTFLYHFSAATVEEHIAPDPDRASQLLRKLKIQDLPEGTSFWFRAGRAKLSEIQGCLELERREESGELSLHLRSESTTLRLTLEIPL